MKRIFNRRLEQEHREGRCCDPCSIEPNAGEIFRFVKDGSAVGATIDGDIKATDGLLAGDRVETARTRSPFTHASAQRRCLDG